MTAPAHGSSTDQVLGLLLDQEEPVTRPFLASACGLSRPTIFTAIQQLEKRGLAHAVGQQSGAPGRSATLYEVPEEAGALAAVDIGGSNVRVVLTDLRGTLVAEQHQPTARPGGPAIVGQATELLRSTLLASRLAAVPLHTIAVSVPGVLSHDGRTVSYASNIDQFEPFDFHTPFADAFHVPVVLDNNVNLAAMGERWRGVARELSTFAVVAVGAGIGAGIVHEGRVMRGAHGAAGEVAFLPPFGKRRKVDARAHDEAGGLSLLHDARSRPGWAGEPPTTVEDLFRRAAAGEKPAVALVEEECARIASVVASICAVIDPEAVVLTGGVGDNDRLIARAAHLAEAMIPFPPSVIRSGLGDRASVIGAVYLAAQSARLALMEVTG
ncbi:ROK family transcriptional regulator [Nocardioides sp. T2.26MG-1]|uniref:ROK family transcriptional regulator n=1 Tax=Nocardioides sp. T2.26MG-1 TaxID=3041166 RepID=UPI002542040D|nr:ROK family transcriptional regulator [Nocardioides sp. T2.26MG-1]